MHQIQFSAGALPHTPLGELTALPGPQTRFGEREGKREREERGKWEVRWKGKGGGGRRRWSGGREREREGEERLKEWEFVPRN